MPLRICKGHTIHKIQGMTVGHGQPFPLIVLHLPESNARSQAPGLELVGASRVDHPDCIAIGNKAASLVRQELQNCLREASEISLERGRDEIRQLGPSEEKTFEGGCQFLLRWYRVTYPLPA